MNNNESTRILHRGQQSVSENETLKEYKKNIHGECLEKMAFTVGGAAMGIAATTSVNGLNAKTLDENSEMSSTEMLCPEAKASANTTEPVTEHSPIVVPQEQESVRAAKVDDSMSFDEAFANARAQVGAGGVFAWNGKVYNTYYREEWEKMSAEERSEWQSHINYADVVKQSEPKMASNQELVDETPVTGEIKVLAVEQVVNEDGTKMNVGLLEASDNNQALLVDIDNDGTFDVLLHDDNSDGLLTENEVYDVSSVNATVEELQQLMDAQSDSMGYCSRNSDMPDYVNDADVQMI